jgi:hypothetical protein
MVSGVWFFRINLKNKNKNKIAKLAPKSVKSKRKIGNPFLFFELKLKMMTHVKSYIDTMINESLFFL